MANIVIRFITRVRAILAIQIPFPKFLIPRLSLRGLMLLVALAAAAMALYVNVYSEKLAITKLREHAEVLEIITNEKTSRTVQFFKGAEVQIDLLDRISHIEGLYLDETDVDDEAMRHVAKCHELGYLGIGSTDIGDQGLAYLADQLPNLWSLSLHPTKISDKGLMAIKTFSLLQYLTLNNTGITDKGCESLVGIPALRNLTLSSTKVTDACFDSLAKMPTLQTVDLRNTAVTDEGIERFATFRPDVQVRKTEPRPLRPGRPSVESE